MNHNGDVALARRLVDAAAECGADAVKFQTFNVDALLTREAPKAGYQVETTGEGESQRDMLARLELGADRLAELRDRAAKHGLVFFSAPFDEASADVLEALDVALFKVPSGEITNLPLLRHVAAKRRPIILSTGMASLDEVGEALDADPRGGRSSRGRAPLPLRLSGARGRGEPRAPWTASPRASAARWASPITPSASRSRWPRWPAERRSSRST